MTSKPFYFIWNMSKRLFIHITFDFRALHGFLTRQQTEEYLNKSPNGTFLIRFSDSEPGGVTIAWITGEKHFEYYHLLLRVLFRSFSKKY